MPLLSIERSQQKVVSILKNLEKQMRFILHAVFFGISGFFAFAAIESLFCLIFSGKYYPYYLVSLGLWTLIGVILLLINGTIILLLKRVFVRFISRESGRSIGTPLFLLLASISPLFIYTVIQLGKHIPGRYWSASNLIIFFITFLLFLFFILYLSKIWTYLGRKKISENYIFILIISGISSISGVFLIISELQAEHWKISIGMIVLFCIILPFFLIYLFVAKIKTRFLFKWILLTVYITFLLAVELHMIRPFRDQFAFKQITNNFVEATELRNPYNIILIVMDTTRAANMSLYGYQRPTTPNLEKFANDAVFFKNATSSSPWTLPSHASLFTGLLSYIHEATHGKTLETFALALGDEFDTLAEILKAHGYATGAVVANVAFLGRWSGLNQGFDHYWWGNSQDQSLLLSTLAPLAFGSDHFSELKKIFGIKGVNSAKRINQIAINWLKKVRKRPFFLFVNYMETHGIEYLPSPYSNLFTTTPDMFRKPRDEENGKPIVSADRKETIISWYDNELASLDNEIGLFLESLKKNGLYEDSIIVIASDHGELLGEHDDFGHSFWLYEELLRIPLLVKYPFNENRVKSVEEHVQLLDVFAELLNYVGIELPSYIQGQPLDNVQHPLVAEVKRLANCADLWPERYDKDQVSLYSRKMPGFKLIQSSDGQKELYNLKDDPSELVNIVDLKKKVEVLENELNEYMLFLTNLDVKKNLVKSKRKELDEATKEQLRALGYIK